MPGRRAFLRRRHVAAAATRQVIIDVIEARRARLGVMRRWRPSARASRPRSDSGRRQVIPVRGGTEPPAWALRCLRGAGGRRHGASLRAAELLLIAGPDDRSHDRHPETLGPPSSSRPRPGSTKRRRELASEVAAPGAVLVQRAGVDQNMTPAAVTAATAKTSLQITCPRRGPEPAAITAKTARMGLEITAAVCALHDMRLITQRDEDPSHPRKPIEYLLVGGNACRNVCTLRSSSYARPQRLLCAICSRKGAGER